MGDRHPAAGHLPSCRHPTGWQPPGEGASPGCKMPDVKRPDGPEWKPSFLFPPLSVSWRWRVSRVSAVRASPASAAAPSLTLTWRVLSRRGVAARHLPSPPLPSGRASPPHPGACSGEGGWRGAGCGLPFARTSQARAPRAAGLHAGAEHGSATAQSSSVGDPRALQPRPGAGREARCAAVRPHRPQWGLLAGGVTCRKPPGWLVRPAG